MLNVSYEIVFDDGSKFDISVIWVDIDCIEDECLFEYDDLIVINNLIVEGGNFEIDNVNVFFID